MGFCTGTCKCGSSCKSCVDFCQQHACGDCQREWLHNDELFFKELKDGHAWQQLPATYFQLHGLKVEMPDLKIRSSIKEADKWIDTTDLIVNGFNIECKSRNEFFTSASTFPFKTILVDTVSGYDAKNIKPLAYIMISRITGAMLALRSTSSKGWKIQSKFDNTRKICDDFYLSDRNNLQTLDNLVNYIKLQEESKFT